VTDAEFGAFVVGCADLIAHEVRRLLRSGVRCDIDDAEQDAARELLEARARFELLGRLDRPLATAIVRRRLLNGYVRTPTTQSRRATEVSADEIEESLGGPADGRPVDRHTIACMTTPSHEDDVIDRVAAEQVDDFVDFLLAPPTPQARYAARRRWLPRMTKFATKEAA
jgi:hypothetical protein